MDPEPDMPGGCNVTSAFSGIEVGYICGARGWTDDGCHWAVFGISVGILSDGEGTTGGRTCGYLAAA